MKAETENIMKEEKEPEEKEIILETPETEQDIRKGTKMESEQKIIKARMGEPTELELLKSIDKKLDILLAERSV